MQRRTLQSITSALRRGVCCCLLFALPVYGMSSLIALLLGANHYHVTSADSRPELAAMQGWQDFRRASPVGDSALHAHSHAGLARHNHVAEQHDVIAVGATERSDGVDGAATLTLASFVFVASQAALLPDAAELVAASGWASAPDSAFLSSEPRRLDRPPKA